MQSDDEPASDVAVKMTQTRSKPKNNGPSQDQMFEERKESLRPKKSRRRAALQEPQTLDTPKVKKRRGRPRKMLEESVLSKSNGQKVQEAPDQNNRGLKSLEVLPTRMQMSYDALAPRGLAEFLEGDGHIDSLSAVDGWRADSQPPGDQYERFEWDWDRPLPDIVTGEVQPRMGPLVEKDVSKPSHLSGKPLVR